MKFVSIFWLAVSRQISNQLFWKHECTKFPVRLSADHTLNCTHQHTCTQKFPLIERTCWLWLSKTRAIHSRITLFSQNHACLKRLRWRGRARKSVFRELNSLRLAEVAWNLLWLMFKVWTAKVRLIFKTVVITSACWLLIRSVAFGNCELERIELRIICALTTNWTRKHLELETIK